MKLNNKSACLIWPWFAGVLLLTIMITLLTGGVKEFYKYKYYGLRGISLNSFYLRHFTREYIQRRYLSLTTSRLPKNTELPSFNIYSDEKTLQSLDSNLPVSGKVRYVQGHINIEYPDASNQSELASEMEFRYRGGLPLHWLYDKKSCRIKLPPFVTYKGSQRFNLVNPSTLPTVTDWVSYDVSNSIGLLTPEYFPARVYINGQYNGLHYFLEQPDESFLRKNHRMPGSIYSGDTFFTPHPFGHDREAREAAYTDDGMSLMWSDHRLWQKDAARNAESENDRRDIKHFIQILENPDPVRFMDSFEEYFDKQMFYKFWGIDVLFGSYHHDNYHNHKLYFDPYKGKFEPVE